MFEAWTMFRAIEDADIIYVDARMTLAFCALCADSENYGPSPGADGEAE